MQRPTLSLNVGHRGLLTAPSTTVGACCLAAGFVLCWSSGFVGSRLAVELNTPVLGLYSYRFALAAALAWIVVACLRRRPGLRPNRQQVQHELLTGSLTVGVYLLAMLIAVAEGVSASVAALIGALQPLAAALLAKHLLHEKSEKAQWWGMGLATLGAAAMITGDMQSAGGAPWWAYLLPLLAVAAVSLGSVLTPPDTSRPGSQHARPEPLSLVLRLALQLSAATLVFVVAALLLEPGVPTPPPLTLDSGVALIWLVLLSTFGGYGFFVASLGRFGVTSTSALIALTPAVTLALSVVLLGDRTDMLGLSGLVVSLLGALWALAAGRQRPGRGADARLTRRGGRSGPRHRDRAVRPAPQTWSTDESRDAAHRVSSPRSPY
ncbi:DMT family transporter [Halomonas sp. DP3Y7-2]|nr:DMT family transporter [Halomonas sp. DP3Y7-2]MBY6227658.1 DMT family transporter [Halomonas sp. DP3Y7-1]